MTTNQSQSNRKGERVNVNGAEKVLKKQPCNILLGAGLESGTSAYKRLVQNYKRWNIQEDPSRGGEEGGSECGMPFGQMKALLQK